MKRARTAPATATLVVETHTFPQQPEPAHMPTRLRPISATTTGLRAIQKCSVKSAIEFSYATSLITH
jgi:hypothetical protein